MNRCPTTLLLVCCAVACAPAPGARDATETNAHESAGAPPVLLSPNGGETWPPGASVVVTWEPGAPSGKVDVHLLRGERVVRTIATQTPDDGTQSWLVPGRLEEGTDYRVRLTAAGGTDASDGAFIVGTPALADYFPLAPGHAWTYAGAEGARITATVRPEPGEVNGQTVTVVRDDTGREDWYALDATGLHLHRIVLPDGGQTLTFTPPVHIAGATLARGQVVRSAGVVTTAGPGADADGVPFSCLVEVDGFQTVRVPAGRFLTVKLGGLLLMGERQRFLFNLWLAPGVGQVQRTGDRRLKLTATSVGVGEVVAAAPPVSAPEAHQAAGSPQPQARK